jgi:hypothetical protein
MRIESLLTWNHFEPNQPGYEVINPGRIVSMDEGYGKAIIRLGWGKLA